MAISTSRAARRVAVSGASISPPYSSTIVFVVRKGNPFHVKDWPDLLAPGLEIVTPDPRTSSNGKLAALAAFAAARTRGASDEEATTVLKHLYDHARHLGEGARNAAIAFAIQEVGDVHLTWENEAIREVEASSGRLEIVYPPVSILGQPYVAAVDRSLRTREKREAARAYLDFLFSPKGQEVFARFGYRPFEAAASARANVTFPAITLIPVTAVARDWSDAYQKFFAENGIVDVIIRAKSEWASR